MGHLRDEPPQPRGGRRADRAGRALQRARARPRGGSRARGGRPARGACGREQPDALRDRLAAPATHVVTLTVTEAGTSAHRRGADRAGAAAHAGGDARARAGGAPRGRGRRAAGDRLLRQPAAQRRACCAGWSRTPALAPGPTGSSEWIAAHADFPSTMVDRIVPAATAGDRDAASRLIGARDEATVVGEPFRQWVIEDSLPRPPAGVGGGRRDARARHPALRGDEAAAAQRRALRARLPRAAARPRDGRRTQSPTPSCARSWSGCGSRSSRRRSTRSRGSTSPATAPTC